MTLRVSIANITPEQAARFFAARGYACSVFPHLGVWEGLVEPGATVSIGFVTPDERLKIFADVTRLARILGESCVYAEHADETRGEIWAAERQASV